MIPLSFPISTLYQWAFIYQCAMLPVTWVACNGVFGRFNLYGRITTQSPWLQRYTLNGIFGWVVAELISPVTFLLGLATFHNGSLLIWWEQAHWQARLLVILWLAHYANRALIQPLLLTDARAPMPAATLSVMIYYNLFNGWLNGSWIADHHQEHNTTLYYIGLVLFLAGAHLNVASDNQLLRMRRLARTASESSSDKPHTKMYRVPYGGAFDWISCPHYAGEIVEWLGWALMANSPPGYLFVLYNLANLMPRAFAVHAWYQQKFPQYPAERRALIPYLL